MGKLVILDVETTGLDQHCGRLLSVGGLVLDNHLQIAEAIPDIVIYSNQATLNVVGMDKKVRDMHSKSGLLSKVQSSTTSLGSAQDLIISILDRHKVDNKKFVLCNNSVHFDRKWLDVHMPSLMKLFSYRMVDVSSFNEMCKILKPALSEKATGFKKFGHTSLQDAKETYDELMIYVNELFGGCNVLA